MSKRIVLLASLAIALAGLTACGGGARYSYRTRTPGGYGYYGARPGPYAYREAPRHRAVWVPGHWEHRHGARIWISGYWR